MTVFRTLFDIPKFEFPIGYNSKVMLIGSCFSDNIGQKLNKLKFDVLSNPYGVLYNPYSIQEVFNHILGNRQLDENDLVEHSGLWHSYLHHGSFSETDKSLLLEKIATVRQKSIEFLKHADFLFITFGTAWVYELISSRRIVSNCHKVPSKEFKRFRLASCDIADEMGMLLQQLEVLNPKLKVIFTLSPIRHLKDGAVENTLSKSILNVSIHNLVNSFTQCSYFPSYELVMDDLRDYRFYAEDMTHLSTQAVDYIFERFGETFLNKDTLNQMEQIKKILKAVAHRSFNPETGAHQKFLANTLNSIQQLQKKYPSQNWIEELKCIEKQML
jgi:hypothetical protein